VTWLCPDIFPQEGDSLYRMNREGGFDLLTTASPMKSLVLESGGPNLKKFLFNKNYFSVPVTQRVHILQQILEALKFLHGLNIVHFDVKPENIVYFPSNSGGSWKLIDFDSSYDVDVTPLPVISCSSRNDDIRVRKEYTSPEVMRVLDHCPSSSNPQLETGHLVSGNGCGVSLLESLSLGHSVSRHRL
jgi:serine/threonine protein kinase